MITTVTASGFARCHNAPQGRNGLEGYQRGEIYRFEQAFRAGKTHFRVYPSISEPKYYETVGKTNFFYYFTPLKEEG